MLIIEVPGNQVQFDVEQFKLFFQISITESSNLSYPGNEVLRHYNCKQWKLQL
jgi:hypothetical protein